MNILFLGSVTDRETVKTLSGGSIAGNKMQLNVLESLVKNHDVKIDTVSILSVAPFPLDKLLYIKKRNIQISERLSAIQIPFINIPLLKQIWQATSVYLAARRIIKKENIDIVFSFNLFPQLGVPLLKIQKKFKLPIVSLLADLPIDANYSRSRISTMVRRYFDYLARNAINKCGNLIVLNENAIFKYAPLANYIVIEGGIDEDEIPQEVVDYSLKTRKNILYSGALSEYSGIINLISAMSKLKDNSIVLDVYGGGYLEGYVRSKARELTNVNYFGKVDNKKMLKLQREAYLLVNPRPINDPISQVTFPSKIFEYMISGTAILTTKLNGFTDGYMDTMFFVHSNDPIELAMKIDEIMKLDTKVLKSKVLKATRFIKQYKTWNKQSDYIYNFMKKIILDQ